MNTSPKQALGGGLAARTLVMEIARHLTLARSQSRPSGLKCGKQTRPVLASQATAFTVAACSPIIMPKGSEPSFGPQVGTTCWTSNKVPRVYPQGTPINLQVRLRAHAPD